MKTKTLSLTIGAASLVLFATLGSAQKQNSAKTETAAGVQTTTFETSAGMIKVRLPDDMAAGDSISGTVIDEPAGKNDKEKERNSAVLNGYVIEIENQKRPVRDSVVRRIQLAAAIHTPVLILLDAKGKQIAMTPIVLQNPVPSVPNTFMLPGLGQSGNPVRIAGPFDGDSSNTKVTIGGTGADVIAESPREVIVETPKEVVGPTKIEVAEKAASASGAFRNLKINLTAAKTSLLKGESTELHVQVSGLQGISEPVPIQVRNQSPSTVNLAGGNTQNIVIQPSQVQTGGNFPWNGNLTGTGRGGFTISADLVR